MSQPQSLLKGTAFITGAASGIGLGIAHAFARSGITNLTLVDVNLSLLTSTSADLKSQFPHLDILTAKVDVCVAAEVQEAVKLTVEKFGRLDVAVNVAGIGGAPKRTSELEESDWRRVVDVNLNGVWRCQREELRVMVEQDDLGPRLGRGNIINISSMYGLTAPPADLTASSYPASKHAVVGLTKADAVQYASSAIRINALCPGYISTPLLMQAGALSGGMVAEIARTPMARLGTVEEIGDCAVFLASQMASFVTGECLLADGGYCCN